MRPPFFEKIEHLIATKNRAVLSVMGEPGFSYSIGNTLRGIPEVLVLGVPPMEAAHLVYTWSELMDQRGLFRDGEMIDIGARFPCMAVTCGDLVREEYTLLVHHFVRPDYDVVQMVAPDEEGRFPSHPLCAKEWRVPILRTRHGSQ